MTKRIPNLKRSYKDSSTNNKSYQVESTKRPRIKQSHTNFSNSNESQGGSFSAPKFKPKAEPKSKTKKYKKTKTTKRPLTAEERQSKKEITRIKRLIKSASSRGYIFPTELKSTLGFLSLDELKGLTTNELYKRAKSYKFGTEMRGDVVRKLERSMTGRKAYESRMLNELIKASEKIGTEDEEEYIPNFTDIVLSEVEAMISYAIANPVVVGNRRTTEDNARDLRYELKNEIEKYGRDVVALSCEQAPDSVKETARETIYASSSTACRAHIEDMLQIIEGYIPTIQEAKQRDMSDITDDNSDLELL